MGCLLNIIMAFLYENQRIGRKLALTISCLFFACFMTGSAFVPNVTTFAVFRFFCGLCAEAIFTIAFIWGNFTDSNFQTSQFHVRMKYLPTKCCVRALSFRFSTKRVQK